MPTSRSSSRATLLGPCEVLKLITTVRTYPLLYVLCIPTKPNSLTNSLSFVDVGPVLTGIFPSCGALQGGTTVTIFGQGLEDATISDNATPLSGPTVELLVPTSLGTTRYFGLNPVVSPIDRTYVFHSLFDRWHDGTILTNRRPTHSITFTTPSLGTDLTFGIQATVQVFWKQVQSRAGVVKPFTYGASVDPTKLNPTHLSLGGGQLISITGCGLSQFNSSQLAVSFGSTAICNRGAGPGSSNDTLFVVPNGDGTDTLYCTQLAIGCTAPGSSYPVTVTINTLPSPIPIGTTITLPSSGTMNITVGPVVDLTTVHPTRGPRLGGTVVAVGGSGFTDSQGTPLPVVVTLSTVGSSSSTFATVNGVVVSDTQFEYTMPPGLFGLDVQASYLFGTGDANCVGGTTARASFHYGPVCSLVAPQYGRVVGGDRVTITGAGFLEDGTLPSDIDVRFCIRRLGYGLYNCSAEPHPRGDFVVTDSTLTVSTPNWRQNVATLVGGNRLFGDKADVYIYFRAPGSNTGNYGPDFNEALLAPGLQKAIIQCSSGSPYTFGPKVTNLTPNKAQSSNLPATTVVASGPGFNDAVYNAHTPLVAFGSQLGLNTAIVADATRDIQTSTIGGPTAPSNTLPTVTVTFNTCNQTTSTTSVTWGPTITAITCTTCDVAGNVLYGLDPAGGQPITIQGTRFDDFLVGATFQATCLIKNTQVPATFVSSTALTCNTPALPWSSRANVAVLFGYIPGDKVQPFNWRNAVASPIQLAYDISILAGSTTPNFGHTSGGTPVQLTVFGIGTWSTPNVIFGSYASPATFAGPNVIVAPTPLDRGDFNTDVKVYVQVGPTYFTQSPDTFHYGPVCTDVVPNNCPTTGCPSTAYLSGSGFQDCNPASTDDRSCRARFFQIEYVNADGSISVVAPVNADVTTGQNTDTKLYYVAPAVTNCNYEPKVQIRFLDAAIATNNSNQNVVQCKASGRPYFFHYGPLFVASNSAHHDASTGYEYGWIGDTVTFTVTNLNDSHIGVPLQCAFRNESNQVSFTTATVTSANTVTCPIGDGNWNSLASVSLEYAVPCEIAVGHVHYGPVLRSIAPTFGRVAGGTPVTISGFGFTCCGIFSINALFPGATNPVSFTETQLTTTVPVNQKIDLLLNNIGASFKSANFPITVGNTFSLYSTETKTSLTYYYGPVVSSIFPGQVQLSGRGQIVTITGSGFADPYFTDAFCDYIATDGSYQLLGSVKLLPNEKSDTQLLCRVLEFSHSCLAVDHISPRWRRFGDEADPLRPEQGRFYWKTVAPPAATFPVATSTDGGSAQRDLPFRLNFGFSILAVSGSLNVPTTGGSILTVTTTNLRDYYSNTSTLDFGPGQAVCVWGNYRSPITTFVPSQDGVTSTVFNCTVPAAPLGYSAPLTVIVNPNENADTTVVGGFEWLPQASSLSRSFGLSTGGDVVIVRGSGFSNYDTVTCYFGGVQAVRSDITNDFSVLCVTPYTQPGQVAVKLQFCKAGNCQQLQSLDAVTVPSPFTFIGINSIYPSAGSICGNTPVQINGYGFSYFDSVQCVFGDLKTPGVIASDSTVECKTADVSALYTVDERAAFCVVTSIIGTRAGESHVVSSSASFEYGFPQVTSVSPATGDIDNLPTLLTIRGLFFNGGKVIDTYTVRHLSLSLSLSLSRFNF